MPFHYPIHDFRIYLRPENSQFNIRRFWEHSVGCAVIADKLYADKLIPMNAKIEFDLYWISALLHDIGKGCLS